ncbi:hypothetical protein DIE22_20510 [Burkholderia sp. Bp9142]|nr:hypothetical protein DIE22_20510 [Burkholderia sp. Bp9142]RQR48208.1 hypothetical protein DIE21_24130 [Burkholderia sp. Bp9140]
MARRRIRRGRAKILLKFVDSANGDGSSANRARERESVKGEAVFSGALYAIQRNDECAANNVLNALSLLMAALKKLTVVAPSARVNLPFNESTRTAIEQYRSF